MAVNGLLRGLWAWITTPATRRTRSPGGPDLNPIDPEGLARELQIEREAERLGKHEQPDTRTTYLSGIEASVIQTVEKARQNYTDWAADRLRHLNQEINGLDLTDVALKLRQLDAEFERRASSLLDNRIAILQELASDTNAKRGELEHFRQRHRLNRPPRVPSSAEKFLRYSILFALVLVEAALNSFFFAKGLWGGLLDGLFFALLFALLNVGFAWVYGRYCVPQLFHGHVLRKLVGLLLLPLCIAAMVSLALLISHYRDAISTGSIETAATLALQSLLQKPAGLVDIYSWLLFLVSIAFACIAMVDSFGLDDPYPGYGAAHERLTRANEDYVSELEDVRESLGLLKTEALEEVDKLIERLHVSLKRLDEAIHQKGVTQSRLSTAFADVDNCLDALIGKFRTTNRLHRTSDAPEYFGKRPVLRQLHELDFSLDGDMQKYQQQRGILNSAQSELQTIRAKIQSSYANQFDRLSPLEQQLDTK